MSRLLVSSFSLAAVRRKLYQQSLRSIGSLRLCSTATLSADLPDVMCAPLPEGTSLRVPISVEVPAFAIDPTSSTCSRLLEGSMHLYRWCAKQADERGAGVDASRQRNKKMVLCIHGSMSDGRVFYSRSGKGLAPYLARCGYDVYVLDLMGRGASRPPIASQPSLPVSQYSAIEHELPTVVDFLRRRYRARQQGKDPDETELTSETAQHKDKVEDLPDEEPFLHVCAHSWGGVLWHSLLARQGDRFVANTCISNVYFGTKRTVSVHNIARLIGLDVMWFPLARLLVRLFGYLPTKRLPIGNDNEPAGSWRQSLPWVSMDGSWTDPCSGFEYGKQLRGLASLPPTLYVAGVKDRFLGHPVDVQRFQAESGMSAAHSFMMFGSAAGRAQWKKLGIPHQMHRYWQPSLVDHDHVSMLAAPSAQTDVFPHIRHWLDTHSKKP